VFRLIRRPPGNRPLRVRVGSHVEAFSRLNDYSEQLLIGFLDAMGVADEVSGTIVGSLTFERI